MIKHEMPDAERLSRYERSQALYGVAIGLSHAGTILGLIGIVLWPCLIAAVVALAMSLIVSRRADSVSPYKQEKAA